MMVESRHSYKPGSRNKNFRNDRSADKMSENRLAWIRTVMGQAVIMYYNSREEGVEETEEEIDHLSELGASVRLMLPRPNARTITFDITSLTMDELVKMREFYNLLFDLAEPSVRQRDKTAQDAFDSGNDSYARSYRPIGQVVVRKGRIGKDDPSLQERLDVFLEATGGERSKQGEG